MNAQFRLKISKLWNWIIRIKTLLRICGHFHGNRTLWKQFPYPQCKHCKYLQTVYISPDAIFRSKLWSTAVKCLKNAALFSINLGFNSVPALCKFWNVIPFTLTFTLSGIGLDLIKFHQWAVSINSNLSVWLRVIRYFLQRFNCTPFLFKATQLTLLLVSIQRILQPCL